MIRKLSALLLALVLGLSCVGAMADSDSITVFNWYDYIDEEVLDIFTEQTGIKVKYVCFTTNEEMFAKLSAGAGSYDIIFPSDYIIERMIKEEGLVALDKTLIPNAENLLDWLQSPAYDPDNTYSIPYMWGTLGILYNTDLVDEEITSWGSFFDTAYTRNVIMMSSYRDALTVALRYLGYSINTLDPDELNEAKELLIQQKADGIVKGYLLDETKDKMIAGEAAMALMYSGDASYSIIEGGEGNLVYVVPKEGSNVWVDGMCIPAGSTNVEGAHAFINFMCDVEAAQMNFEYIYYSSPIKQVAENYTEEELEMTSINPPQELIDLCTFFHDVSENIELYEDIWVSILN